MVTKSLLVALEIEPFPKLNYIEIEFSEFAMVGSRRNQRNLKNAILEILNCLRLRNTNVQASVEMLRFNVEFKKYSDGIITLLAASIQYIPVPQIIGFHYNIHVCNLEPWNVHCNAINSLLLRFAQSELPFMRLSVSCTKAYVEIQSVVVKNIQQGFESLAADSHFFPQKLHNAGTGCDKFVFKMTKYENHYSGIAKKLRGSPYTEFIASYKWIHPTSGEKNFQLVCDLGKHALLKGSIDL
jgi:hypothetical protein